MNALKILAAALLATASLGAHAVGRLADVSIHDRATGRDLPVYWHEGRAYVVGRPGNEYQVSVRNPRGDDLLAVVSVDGVNVLSGKTAKPSQQGYIVGSWQQVDIKGWRKSLDEIAAFYFTTLPDSYAGRTGRPNDVGVIGVALYQRAKPAYVPPPVTMAPPAAAESSEPFRSRNESALGSGAADLAKRAMPQAPAAAPLGTGHGRREESSVRYSEFERSTREPVETIAIYYDSYRNLVAQGVIPTYGSHRTPNPFPNAFVPDPR